jgi:hypothetical protein
MHNKANLAIPAACFNLEIAGLFVTVMVKLKVETKHNLCLRIMDSRKYLISEKAWQCKLCRLAS